MNKFASSKLSASWRQAQFQALAPRALQAMGVAPNAENQARMQKCLADQPTRLKRALQVENQIATLNRSKRR